MLTTKQRQTLSRNIIQPGGCNMYIKKITLVAWALNFAIVAMVGYVWGHYDGQQVEKQVDMQMQIRYAVAQAMIEGQ